MEKQKKIKEIIITLAWYRHRMWGYCPKGSAEVIYKDGTRERRSGYKALGCGYDKTSTILAEVFNDFLKYKIRKRKTPAPYGVYMNNGKRYGGGIGETCYYQIAKWIGGRLEKIVETDKVDVFILKLK